MHDEDDDIALILLKVFKGSCPYCGSKMVNQVSGKFGFKTGGNSSKYPDADTASWLCAGCNRTFHVKD